MRSEGSCRSAGRAVAPSGCKRLRFIANTNTRVCWSRVFDLSAFQLDGETTENGSERNVTASYATPRVVVPVPSVSSTGLPGTPCALADETEARTAQTKSHRVRPA